jgi:hypothetical protein
MDVGVLFHSVQPLVGGVPLAGLHRPKVTARAKDTAGACENDRPHIVVGIGLIPGVGHAHQHLDAERVLLLGPVERANREVTALLIEEMGLRHLATLRAGFELQSYNERYI